MMRVVLIIRLFKILLLSIALLLMNVRSMACAESMPTVSACSCVVMFEDGQTVYEKNADTRSLIASTTKLMTALVCLENARLDDTVTIRPACCQVEGSSMYLKTGESYTVRELLLGLLLASGNDAALALAEHVAGSEQAYLHAVAHERGLFIQLQPAPRAADDYAVVRLDRVAAAYGFDYDALRHRRLRPPEAAPDRVPLPRRRAWARACSRRPDPGSYRAWAPASPPA